MTSEYLIERIKKTAVIIIIGLLLFELGTLIAIYFIKPMPIKSLVAILIIVLIFNSVIFYIIHFFIAIPIRNQEASNTAFVNSEDINEVYAPDLFWSRSTASVIKRYQKKTNRRLSVEKSVEASRYMALQQQINPHFLYNTLDSIRSDLLIGEDSENLASTIEALAKYFSYVVSDHGHLASVNDEIGNVLDYFSIQKYRFGDRIELEIKNELSENEIFDLYMPRMTIQPLVENAITHGLELLGRQGIITLLISRTPDRLLIDVSDNGEGMDAETLKRLNESLVSSSDNNADSRKRRGGIALKNVNSRIRMLFGENYGIVAESIVGVGTVVRIVLPIKEKEVVE